MGDNIHSGETQEETKTEETPEYLAKIESLEKAMAKMAESQQKFIETQMKVATMNITPPQMQAMPQMDELDMFIADTIKEYKANPNRLYSRVDRTDQRKIFVV